MSEVNYKSLAELTLSIKDGTHGTHPRVSKGIPFLSAKNITNGQIVIKNEEDYISEQESQLINRSFPLELGDVLLTVVGTLGRVAIYNGENVSFQRSVAFIRPDPSKVSSRYLYHALSHKRFMAQLIQRSNATAQAGVYLGELAKTIIPVFDEKSHELIADIIDSIDTQIRETETIIAKLQQVKQGLLHDLLTRGVDENGELRPSYQDASELYKPSGLGWIPKDWDAVNVGSQINIKHGFAFDGSLFTTVPSEYPLLVPGNFHRNGRLYFTQNNTKYFKGKYSDEYLLKPRDIVVVMTDLSPQTLILGRAAILDDSQWLLHNQRVGKIEFKCEDEWDKNFFVESLSQETLRRKIILTATGTTVRHTSPDRIYALDIAKPLIDEQRSISGIIANAWARLTEESDKLVKLKLQKSGLMDDLLTGKKRVTDLLKQNQAS